jgi:hypothetical protein
MVKPAADQDVSAQAALMMAQPLPPALFAALVCKIYNDAWPSYRTYLGPCIHSLALRRRLHYVRVLSAPPISPAH